MITNWEEVVNRITDTTEEWKDCYAYAASGTFCGGSNKSRQIV